MKKINAYTFEFDAKYEGVAMLGMKTRSVIVLKMAIYWGNNIVRLRTSFEL